MRALITNLSNNFKNPTEGLRIGNILSFDLKSNTNHLVIESNIKNQKKIFSFWFFILSMLITFAVKAQVCFNPSANIWGGDSASTGITSADFNGDGKLDLAVTNNTTLNVNIMLGNGVGGFSAPVPFAIPGVGYDITSTDFNGDGKADLAVANYIAYDPNDPTPYWVSILLGDGTGGFSPATNIVLPASPESIVSADFNGDGKMDLVTSNFGSSISVLLGNGTGGFSLNTVNVMNVFYSVGGGKIISEDLNADGKYDLALCVDAVDSVVVLLGNGTGSFGAPAYFPVSAPSSLTCSDFNGDGKKDLAVASEWSAAVLLGNGTGGFGAASYFTLPSGSANVVSVVSTDFNYDGKVDLALANEGWDVNVLLGDGTGGFGAPVQSGYCTPFNFNVGNQPLSIISADFNGDCKTDLATANTYNYVIDNNVYNGSVSVLLNCNATSGCDSTLNVADLMSAQTVSIFPNPSNGQFTIKNSQLNNRQYMLKVIDILGREVDSRILSNTLSQQINITDIANGIYSIIIENNGKKYQDKLIIQK